MRIWNEILPWLGMHECMTFYGKLGNDGFGEGLVACLPSSSSWIFQIAYLLHDANSMGDMAERNARVFRKLYET